MHVVPRLQFPVRSSQFGFVFYCFLNDLPLCRSISPQEGEGEELETRELTNMKYERRWTKTKPNTRINITVAARL